MLMGGYMGGGGRLYGLTCQLLERLSPLKMNVIFIAILETKISGIMKFLPNFI